MKSFKLYRGFAALLLLGVLSACSHFSKSDEGEQQVSGNTAGGDSEGLSEDAKGAILGGAIGASPGMAAIGMSLAACGATGPFMVISCPLMLGLSAGLTVAGGAAGAYVGYNAKATNDYVAQDTGDPQTITGSVSTVISSQAIGQPLDENKTNVVGIEPVADSESAVMVALTDEGTNPEPVSAIADPTADPVDINAYLFFRGEEKIFASVKKIAGIFNREAE